MQLRPNLTSAQVRGHVDRVGRGAVGLVGYSSEVIWVPLDRETAFRVLREAGASARYDMFAVTDDSGGIAEVRFMPARERPEET